MVKSVMPGEGFMLEVPDKFEGLPFTLFVLDDHDSRTWLAGRKDPLFFNCYRRARSAGSYLFVIVVQSQGQVSFSIGFSRPPQPGRWSEGKCQRLFRLVHRMLVALGRSSPALRLLLVGPEGEKRCTCRGNGLALF